MIFGPFIYHAKELFNGALRHCGGLFAFPSVKAGTPVVGGGADVWGAAPCAGANRAVNGGTYIQNGLGIILMLKPIIAGTRELTQSGSVTSNPLPFPPFL